MSPTYLVENATKKKEIEGRNGPLAIWELQLKDGESTVTCELAQMATTPAPYAGQSVEGAIDHSGPYGAKFKKASRGQSNGGGDSGGYSPKKEKEIVRQHSQKVAMQYVTAKAYLKAVNDFTVEDVCKIAAAFQDDVEGQA